MHTVAKASPPQQKVDTLLEKDCGLWESEGCVVWVDIRGYGGAILFNIRFSHHWAAQILLCTTAAAF